MSEVAGGGGVRGEECVRGWGVVVEVRNVSGGGG